MIQILKLSMFMCWLVSGLNSHAQGIVIKKSTLSNTGNSYVLQGSNVLISQTIGQPSLTSHFQSGSFLLLQGFEYALVEQLQFSGSTITSTSVYPNPSNGRMTLKWQGEMHSEMVQIEIFDLNGRKMSVHEARREGMTAKLDLETTPEGNYILEAVGEESGATSRIIMIRK